MNINLMSNTPVVYELIDTAYEYERSNLNNQNTNNDDNNVNRNSEINSINFTEIQKESPDQKLKLTYSNKIDYSNLEHFQKIHHLVIDCSKEDRDKLLTNSETHESFNPTFIKFISQHLPQLKGLELNLPFT